jgi:hypothetical protein
MAEIGDIPPLKPVWPDREKDERKRGQIKKKKQDKDKRKPDEDGHIDEYA